MKASVMMMRGQNIYEVQPGDCEDCAYLDVYQGCNKWCPGTRQLGKLLWPMEDNGRWVQIEGIFV